MAAIETIEAIKPSRNDKPVRKRTVYYPTGDGKPMAEDTLHREQMAYCCDALKYRFASRPDVYVAGNDFVYYQEGSPRIRVSPDCYVVIGVEKKRRKSYKIWDENGIAPAVVFEITSKATQKEDVEDKRPLYEQTLRVAEYFQFDPTGDYLQTRLQGQRLQGGTYQNIELRDNRLWSEQLQLELVVQNDTLRFYDPATSEWLPTYEEARQQRRAAERQAQMEAQRARAAEKLAQVEARRANEETRRANEETRRAQSAERQAQAEAQRADEETRRADSAEAALAQLLAEMEAMRQQK